MRPLPSLVVSAALHSLDDIGILYVCQMLGIPLMGSMSGLRCCILTACYSRPFHWCMAVVQDAKGASANCVAAFAEQDRLALEG